MKNRIHLVLLAVACMILGCRDEVAQRYEEIMNNVDAATKVAAERGWRPPLGEYRDTAYRLVSSIKDEQERRKAIEAWMDRLLEFDFSHLTYSHQYDVDYYIRYEYDKLINLLPGNGFNKPMNFEHRIKLLGWWRKQLNRFKPKHRRDKISDANNPEVDTWRSMYFGNIVCYEMALHDLEQDAINVVRYAAKDDTTKIRAMVEKYVGRQIRSSEQLYKDSQDKRHVEFTDTYNLYDMP